jgi:hypothetical protein
VVERGVWNLKLGSSASSDGLWHLVENWEARSYPAFGISFYSKDTGLLILYFYGPKHGEISTVTNGYKHSHVTLVGDFRVYTLAVMFRNYPVWGERNITATVTDQLY